MSRDLVNQDIDTRGLTLWQLIVARVATTPGATMAVDDAGRTLTYGGYHRWCERVAAGLARRGVGEGTAVSWMLPTRFEALVLSGALSRLGAVQNPILPVYRHRETRFIVEETGAELLVVPGTFRGFDYPAMAGEAVAGLRSAVVVADPDLPEADPAPAGALPAPPTDPEAVRWVFYSSGTTADPKGARHRDRSLAAANDGMQWSLRCGPGDRAAVVFPITHIGGMVFLYNSLQTGARLLLVETFDPATTPVWLGDQGVTHAGSGTVFFQAYLAAQRAQPERRIMPDVKVFNGGGAPKPAHLHGELLAEMGAPLLSGWGMTECPIDTMSPPGAPDDKLAGTEGRAVPGAGVRVVRTDGSVAGPGEEGELQVQGPQLFAGYVDARLDAEAFTGPPDDRWFRTGDLGIIDGEGYVRITGRLKDVIIRKGENISAKEVEDVIHTLPGVADVAVIGLPDPATGERCCAVVAAGDGPPVTLERLAAHVRGAGLAPHKIPEQLDVVDVLPRNPTGKVLKHELRARLSAGGDPGA